MSFERQFSQICVLILYVQYLRGNSKFWPKLEYT